MSDKQTHMEGSWDRFSGALQCPDTECPAEFGNIDKTVAYLRATFGEDYLDRVQAVPGHPFWGVFRISWAGLRSDFLAWVAHLQRVSQCPNFKTVLQDLGTRNKCVHAYGLTKTCGRMRKHGAEVTFEPELDVAFQFRPDARIRFPSTEETFFLEFSCQSLANKQLSAFEAMSECRKPIDRHFETLKCSFRLSTTPGADHMQDIVRKIEVAIQEVLTTGQLAEVHEEGVLEMGISRVADAEGLEAWCKRRGVRFSCHEGPRDDTNALDRLRNKIRQKQRQLPRGYPNVLAIENNHIFAQDRSVLQLISELQEELYNHGNLAVLLIEGSSGSSRGEDGLDITRAEHRFQRRVRGGQVRRALLCCNRYADVQPSAGLVELLSKAHFDR